MKKKSKPKGPCVVSTLKEGPYLRKDLMMDYQDRYFIRTTFKSINCVTDADHTLWTVYTKDSECGRGDYADEIDVLISVGGRATEAKKVAHAAIQAHYSPDLRVAKAVPRVAGFAFM